MSSSHLESVALGLVAESKGILAADETVPRTGPGGVGTGCSAASDYEFESNQ